jgi:pSer/pThr/pTyr-binding forkhead associated (FHA) protein
VRNGGLAGRRLSVKTPVVNIGRADYNDLVVPDPSVSTSHAKLQRREGVWVLTDLDSTNGTFVDGDRVQGEAPLAPGASVQFGDVQLVFEPSDDTVGVAKGGGTQMLRTPHSVAPNVPPSPASSPARGAKAAPARPGARPAPKRPAAQQPPPKKGKGCGGSAAVLVVGGGALVALLHRLLA